MVADQRFVFVTFGCVTLPRRFRLGIVFGGEVWRSADSPLNIADLCPAIPDMGLLYLLAYCTVWCLDFAFWSILECSILECSVFPVCLCIISVFEKCRWRSITCVIRCISSSIFWTGIFEMPEVYIMVEHAVDRPLERAVMLWRCVELSIRTRKICVVKSVWCVGWS